jgi:hypothetical protein
MPKGSGLHRKASGEIRAGYQTQVASPVAKRPPLTQKGNGPTPGKKR